MNTRITSLVAVIIGSACAANAMAAVATFAVNGSSTVFAGTPIEVALSVSRETLPSYDWAEILVGSDDATDLTFSGYDDEWDTAFATTFPPQDESFKGSYDQEIYIGGDNNGMQIFDATLAVGTLVIDTTGMAPGDYSIGVDSDFDSISKLQISGEGGGNDLIFGQFQFTILPEPSTLLILAAGIFTLSARIRCRSGRHTP